VREEGRERKGVEEKKSGDSWKHLKENEAGDLCTSGNIRKLLSKKL
jgi:hypothetical protein